MQDEIPVQHDAPRDDADRLESTTATDGFAPGSEELTALEAQRERYLRLAAEFDNFRKRTARDAVQERARGQGELIKGLLNSLDDLDRFTHLDPTVADPQTVMDGISMVEKNIQKALAGAGVEIIDPVELPFDPNLMEAVSTQAAETPEEDHMVAQVFQRGYMLNGQLLRPARVVVKQYQ